MNGNAPGTAIIDIDGTVLDNRGLGMSDALAGGHYALKGVRKMFDALHDAGHFIMLVTARPQSHRSYTERELFGMGLYWDMLVMGVPKGTRVVVNDMKPGSDRLVAAGVQHVRNSEWRAEDVDALLSLLDGKEVRLD